MKIECVPQKQKLTPFKVKTMEAFKNNSFRKRMPQKTNFIRLKPFLVEIVKVQHRMAVFGWLKLREQTQLYRSIGPRFGGVYVASTICIN